MTTNDRKQIGYAAGSVALFGLIVLSVAATKLTPSEKSDLQFYRANIKAGILKEIPSTGTTVGTMDVDPSTGGGRPKAGNPCSLVVQGKLSPQGNQPILSSLSCSKTPVPHQWWGWTNTGGICSGDIVVAAWGPEATNNNAAWPAITFTGQGQYTNGMPWGPLATNAMMAAKCRSITALVFEYCPEALPDLPKVYCTVRCSPYLPLDIPMGTTPPAWATNRLKTTPTNGAFQLDLTNWAGNVSVDIYETPALGVPYWQKIGEVRTAANGTASTNIQMVFPNAFYMAVAQ